MCDVIRCKRTDVAVIYAATESADAKDGSFSNYGLREEYEICGRCWEKHGGKSCREILALLR